MWCVGAGAVGGCVAARLARAGVEPVVIDANAEHAKRLRTDGLVVDGVDGGATTRLDAHTPDELDAIDVPADLVLLAVRSTDTVAAVTELLPHLSPTSDVVSLQNGLNEDAIASVVGPDRTIGCVVGFGATWIEAGRVRLDVDGELQIGRLDGSTDERLEHARHHLDCAFMTTVTRNVRGALWAKMLVNSMTVLGALGGMLTGEVLSTPARRRIVAEIVAEGVDVAAAEGVELPPVFGRVDAALVRDRGPGWADELDEALDRFGTRRGAIKSVTWRDMELGRPTEIDAVTGEIVRRGAEHGVATPRSAAVYAMLREIESGHREASAANLDALA